ncbi:MAG TPA: hypothetical protein VNZ45_16990 [Bacteroidia bacterium]|jgi:hypothetical protein|nr:hypothetical protein [Bacteroidia bacterium]
MSKRILPLLFFCISVFVNAQDYKWQAKFDTITSDGFYRIQLLPPITSKTLSDFCDVRILDAQNREVPYIIHNETPMVYYDLLKEYKIISLSRVGKHTRLIIGNPAKNKIDNINLVIKNADVTKTLRLSGSEDTIQWFVIRDNYTISDVYNNLTTSTVKIFDFPLSDYKYFKIDISDSLSPPINILKAGYYDTYSEAGKYTELPAPQVTQVDSAEKSETYVKVSFAEPQLINKIYIEVQGPHYYFRDACIGVIEESGRKGLKIFYPRSESFILSSNSEHSIHSPEFKGNVFYLRITNHDNPPLKIKSVKAYQLNNSLVTYLEKNKSYRLIFGNTHAVRPTYDLGNFKDSISSVKTISIGNIIPNGKGKIVATPTTNSIFGNKALMWGALIIVLLILGLMSLRMVKEIGKK